MARAAGCEVLNFSRGGMTASEYNDSFGEANGFFDPEKSCQAYIIALGVNDLCNRHDEIGSTDDIDLNDWRNNADTFAGQYAKLIQRYREISPKSRIFLMTMVPNGRRAEGIIEEHRKLLHEIAALFPFTWVLDFCEYAPPHDEEFRKHFYLGGHLNAMGYMLTARQVMTYIDFIIRNNYEDFSQVAFIGRGGVHNCEAKW